MLEKLSESSGSIVGYKVAGKVTAEDYQQLEPEVQTLVDQYDDDVCLLLNLQEFAGEEANGANKTLPNGIDKTGNIAGT